jgi:uncharacterized protein (TIGR00725 family)
MVAVIGDGGIAAGSSKYVLAREVGRVLCERGFRIVTGGLGGVMEAASLGARESSAWTPGSVIALLPGFDPDHANPYADVVIPTGLDHLRNSLVVQADAVVAIGGGLGRSPRSGLRGSTAGSSSRCASRVGAASWPTGGSTNASATRTSWTIACSVHRTRWRRQTS